MNERTWRLVETLIAWLVGGYFIYAAVAKVADPHQFAQSIKYYKIVPLWAVNIQAVLMPWWELAAGVALLFRGWRRAGAVLTFALLIIFTAALISAIARKLDITCGCTGKSSATLVQTLIQDLAMLWGMGVLIWYRPKRASLPSSEPQAAVA